MQQKPIIANQMFEKKSCLQFDTNFVWIKRKNYFSGCRKKFRFFPFPTRWERFFSVFRSKTWKTEIFRFHFLSEKYQLKICFQAFFFRCSFAGVRCSAENFTVVETDFGICYTFGAPGEKEHIVPSSGKNIIPN